MTTMRWSPGRSAPRTALLAGALLMATLGPATRAAAQDRPSRSERTECTCVDRNGKKIDDCTCLRGLPDAGRIALMGRFPDQKARLGVVVSADQAADADAKGARLQSVTEGGPADEAGLKEGDVITRIDGKSLFDPLDAETERGFDLDASVPVQRLLAIAGKLEPGQKVEVEYLRDGTAHTATVEAREMGGWTTFGGDAGTMRDRMRELAGRMRTLRLDRGEGGGALEFRGPEEGGADSAGAFKFRVAPDGLFWKTDDAKVELTPMNPGLGRYFGTDKGVLVSDVADDSPLGLQAGDVVLAVGNREVSDADHLRRILRSYDPDETITFRVMRQKKETTVQGHRAR